MCSVAAAAGATDVVDTPNEAIVAVLWQSCQMSLLHSLLGAGLVTLATLGVALAGLGAAALAAVAAIVVVHPLLLQLASGGSVVVQVAPWSE